MKKENNFRAIPMLDELGFDFMEISKKVGDIQEIMFALKEQFPMETKKTLDYNKLTENLRKMSISSLRKYFVEVILKISGDEHKRFVEDVKREVFHRFLIKIPKEDYKILTNKYCKEENKNG